MRSICVGNAVAHLSKNHPLKMKTNLSPLPPSGKIGWVLLWLIGIPVPVLIILFVLRGCT